MSDLQVIASTQHNVTEQIELQSFDLPQNYSLLINKLEQLALGLDSAFGNLSHDRKEIDIAFSTSSRDADIEDYLDLPVAAGRAPPPHSHAHGMGGSAEMEFTHVVSDIWIGVILTLLIVSVIFFICACFLYHKFQQWKNSYRTNHSDPIEICRRYPPDYEAESLPSYTIVSGLPSYDDALEEFRKAGIILTPPIPVIKIFDGEAKNASIFNIEDTLHEITVNGGNSNTINATADNISLSSTCTCGASSTATSYYNAATPNNSMMSVCLPNGSSAATQIIELSPEQLAALSQKRLSLQIAFNSSVRRSSRPRIDLYREANRNNHLRSRAMSNAGLELPFPEVHRRASSSLSLERNGLPQMHHRGSLC